jgi:hypothetical protein
VTAAIVVAAGGATMAALERCRGIQHVFGGA